MCDTFILMLSLPPTPATNSGSPIFPGWPQIHCTAEDNPELLMHLPLSSKC